MPSSLHSPGPSFRLDCSEIPSENGEFTYRHRCLPRKRRVLQQPYLQHQQTWPDGLRTAPHINTAQKLLSSNICLSSASNTASPPISPKTLIPSHPHQQNPNPCTSASSLRPCHICHRRPTTRELLDAYADCDLCGQRACYICLRQCDAVDCCGSIDLFANNLFRDGSDRLQEGIDGNETGLRQPRKICSSCAVEGVTDMGMEVVRCLDCVRGHLTQWPPGQSG